MKQSLVVIDPIGNRKTAERVVHRRDYDTDPGDTVLLKDLSDAIIKYIEVVAEAGWDCNVIDEPGYKWRKRVEAVDKYGRLRAVRDFSVIAFDEVW